MRQGANKLKRCNNTEQDEQSSWCCEYVLNSHAPSKLETSATLRLPEVSVFCILKGNKITKHLRVYHHIILHL